MAISDQWVAADVVAMQHLLQLRLLVAVQHLLQHHVLLRLQAADQVALAVCLTESEAWAVVHVVLLPAAVIQLQPQQFKLQHLLLSFQQLPAADAEHLRVTLAAAVVADLIFVDE